MAKSTFDKISGLEFELNIAQHKVIRWQKRVKNFKKKIKKEKKKLKKEVKENEPK